MASCRPASITVDSQERLDTNKAALAALKPRLRTVLSEAWLRAIDEVPQKLLHPEGPWKEAIEPKVEDEEEADEDDEDDETADDDEDKADADDGEKIAEDSKYRDRKVEQRRLDPLYAWRLLRNVEGDSFRREWAALSEEWQASLEAVRARREHDYDVKWDMTGDRATTWFGHGNGLTSQPSQAGEFHILAEGDRIVGNILPAGMYSHTLSDKHSAVLSSPRFGVKGEKIFARVVGGGNAAARYVVQNYPLRGPPYPLDKLEDGVWRWQEWDTAYWEGEQLYIEIATAADQPARVKDYRERSWFGVAEALLVKDGEPEPRDELAEFVAPLFEASGGPAGVEALAKRYAEALRACVMAWRDGAMTDEEARFLDYFVGAGLLPNVLNEVPAAETLLVEYRRLEREAPVPRRAPGVLEGNPFDQPLFVRGDHHQPAEPVPRRFLEVIDDTPYDTEDAGRTALADSILDPDNPLSSRVIANRLWHHVFGSGIVATPDNFGHLGELPSHPELLDYLAARFVDEGWSIKEFLRFLVTSRTFQLTATPSAKAKVVDPLNRLLSHSSVRRLEGEAIRDSMLMVAGRLDPTPFGEPVDGNTNRRSVYVRVIRNKLDPFLSVFDAPVPTSTVGRRNATNVPAQALAMMNDPLVIDLAGSFASRMKNEDPNCTQEQRIARMFEHALGRPPLPEEAERTRMFLVEATKTDSGRQSEEERIRVEIAKIRERIDSLCAKAEERVEKFLKRNAEAIEETPSPIAAWDFDEDGRDRIGSLHAELRGGARIEEGALVLDGDGAYAVTSPLGRDLTVKTLEVWVEPADTEQQGVVMAVRTDGAGAFDAIGLSAESPHRWKAYSDRDLPSPDLEDDIKKETPEHPNHVVITYSHDGAITCFRNGFKFGTTYMAGGASTFSRGVSVVRFGMSKPDAVPMLRGRILAARLYEEELSDDEIAILSASMPDYIPKERLPQLLTSRDRSSLATLESELERLMRCAGPPDPWRELAHAIFNLKEFIYLM